MTSPRSLATLCLTALIILSGCSIRRIGDADATAAPNASPQPAATLSVESLAPDATVAPDESDSAESESAATVDESEAPETESIAPAGVYEPMVFMYHLILDEPYSQYEGLFVRPSEFREQLETLRSLGYRFAFAEDYRETYEYPTAIITLDDGYEDNYTEMFPILSELGGRATVFLATSLVGTPGYLTEAQIKEMSASGLVSFQSHTVAHVDLSNQSADFIERDTQDAIAYIEGLTGRPVRSMAYPAGSFNDTVRAAVGKYIDFAYTTEPPSQRTVDGPLAIPRIRIARGLSQSAFRSMCEY